jgi:uncharacterized protein DUF5677
MNVNVLRESVEVILAKIRPWVESKSRVEWNLGSPILPILFNAIVRRQFEFLESISFLAASGRGYAGAPLIRPACEERIWAKYLRQIDPADAERLILVMNMHETNRNLEAQEEYTSPAVMQELGLTEHIRRSRGIIENVKNDIQQLGQRLSWGERTVSNKKFPSVWWIAEKTGLERLYGFLYHGPSRYVHFNPVELMRRIWGRSGVMNLDSATWSDYWAVFSLYWGLQLYLQTSHEIFPSEDVIADADSLAVAEAVKAINEHGAIQLIFPEEMAWETD